MWEYRHPDVECFTSQVCTVSKIVFSPIKCVPQVKPKLTQVRDISKKINKDTGDDAGIFMGDCKYFTLKYQPTYLTFFIQYTQYSVKPQL